MVAAGRQNPTPPQVLIMKLSHIVIKSYSTSSFLCSTKYEKCLIQCIIIKMKTRAGAPA